MNSYCGQKARTTGVSNPFLRLLWILTVFSNSASIAQNVTYQILNTGGTFDWSGY
ncbi:hypothetical protein SAMN05216327_11099 [Dyadobacter sp. SG02]|uniref:hypothetical protein n=1 Tax=Dyadobacter sp. SG02 TaxID=1855291 RepID=UPI0008B54E87|nr:hypothetical protein [Dyadobacter sp. SG02]SEJ43708.1 hypothetical protein SAMN05216327_11099 [Dyadobacter sp. SG02]